MNPYHKNAAQDTPRSSAFKPKPVDNCNQIRARMYTENDVIHYDIIHSFIEGDLKVDRSGSHSSGRTGSASDGIGRKSKITVEHQKVAGRTQRRVLGTKEVLVQSDNAMKEYRPCSSQPFPGLIPLPPQIPIPN